MIINLVSSLDDNANIDSLNRPNNVYTWFLREGFGEIGIECNFVNDNALLSHRECPHADHTIVTSAAGNAIIINPTMSKKVRNATKGKLANYVSTDVINVKNPRTRYYDVVFTQTELGKRSGDKYVYAGWGADQKYCHPDDEKDALYLDSFVPWYKKEPEKIDSAYGIYDKIIPATGYKVHNPVKWYENPVKWKWKGHGGDKSYPGPYRVRWVEIQGRLRKCRFFCCTQRGNGGMIRLEAAACGALLVVPKNIYATAAATMNLFEHRIWSTEAELLDILNSTPDPKEIVQKAWKHTWKKVANRIIGGLES